MAATRRSTEDVRREIEREREELVQAVTHLRSDIHEATNVKPLLRKVAIGAAVAAVAYVALKLARR